VVVALTCPIVLIQYQLKSLKRASILIVTGLLCLYWKFVWQIVPVM